MSKFRKMIESSLFVYWFTLFSALAMLIVGFCMGYKQGVTGIAQSCKVNKHFYYKPHNYTCSRE